MLAAGFLCLVIACTARAADSIYWANAENNTISHANLAGGGGAAVPIASPFVDTPVGLAVDAANGKLYWANPAEAKVVPPSIGSANLDGSGAGLLNLAGAPQQSPSALAIDVKAGRVYWSDESTPGIFFANLSGGAVGTIDTTGVTLEDPNNLVVHPAAGKIYWEDKGSIAFANLGGGGSGGLLDLGATPIELAGTAIDASSNRIYWVDAETDTIHFTSLSGGAGGVVDTTGAVLREPVGLAIDPEAGRIYWADFLSNTIGFASLKGGGGGQLDTTGATPSGPVSAILLKTPLAAAPPLVKGRPRGGSQLTCESTWAGDLVESFLYRAPRTVAYQWLRNGQPIAGATATTVEANIVGRYTCQATATNFAGPTTATSAAIDVRAALKLGKLRLNPVAGTATLKVAAFGAGKLTLTGAGVKRQSVKARSSAQLKIRPKPSVKKRLKQNARARVKVRITFRPTGGKPIRRSKTVVLRKAGLSRR